MTRTKSLGKVVLALALVGVLGFALIGAGSAILPTTQISADQPDSQEIDVTANFSSQGNVTAQIVSDGTTVESTTISGSSGTVTGTLDLTGLQTGDYNFSVSDHQNATLESTTMRTTVTQAVNATKNETVEALVDYSASEMVASTVTFEQGTNTASENLVFDPVDFADGTGTKTANYTAPGTGYVNVTVETVSADGYESVSVGFEDEAILGGLTGSGDLSDTQILLISLAAIFGVGYLMSRRDM